MSESLSFKDKEFGSISSEEISFLCKNLANIIIDRGEISDTEGGMPITFKLYLDKFLFDDPGVEFDWQAIEMSLDSTGGDQSLEPDIHVTIYQEEDINEYKKVNFRKEYYFFIDQLGYNGIVTDNGIKNLEHRRLSLKDISSKQLIRQIMSEELFYDNEYTKPRRINRNDIDTLNKLLDLFECR